MEKTYCTFSGKIILTISFIVFQLYSLIAQPQIEFETFVSGFTKPVDIAAPNDGSNRLFVVEKEGFIRIIENGTKSITPFLNISSKLNTASEAGLLGLVFHPEFSENGFFFINYVDQSNYTTISRFQVLSSDPNKADLSSEKKLMQIFQPANNHNAGDLNFGPLDGYLYIPMGDGGGAGDPSCYAQDSSSYLGKIIRIDVNQNINSTPYYGIPTDNPYLDIELVPDEIWAFGLRNPWRSSFDRKTGDFWIADVGQGAREELNLIPAGSPFGLNFGWKIKEGELCYGTSSCDSNIPECNSGEYKEPIFTYNRTASGGRSITGGYVYRGCKYPGMYGYYIYTDYISGNSWYGNSNEGFVRFAGAPTRVTTYGEDEAGELYVASYDTGVIYKVIDKSIPSVLKLSGENFPLAGEYIALDTIIITEPFTFTSSDVIFNSPILKIGNEIQISPNSGFRVNKWDCNDSLIKE